MREIEADLLDLIEPPTNRLDIDPQWLSDTIGMIYDCVLTPDLWADVVAVIAQYFRFHSAELSVLQLTRGGHQFMVSHGADEEWRSVVQQYLPVTLHLWGGPDRIAVYPLDEPIVCSWISPKIDFTQNAYYQDILGPRGLRDAMGVVLARSAGLTGYFALNRHYSEGPIRPEHVEGLRLLAPHMRRALTISNHFDLKLVELEGFNSIFEGTKCAVVIVDEVMSVLRMNRAAAELVERGHLLGRMGSILSIPGTMESQALGRAVRTAAMSEAALGHQGLDIPIRTQKGSAAVLHVLPLGGGRKGLAMNGVAAIFVAVDEPGIQPPVNAVALIYDLSPAEQQVFASIAAGRSVAETADTNGIGQSTVRTHLHRIFAKTGCSRQAELVALAARLAV